MPRAAAKSRARAGSLAATAASTASGTSRAGAISAFAVMRAVPSVPMRTRSIWPPRFTFADFVIRHITRSHAVAITQPPAETLLQLRTPGVTARQAHRPGERLPQLTLAHLADVGHRDQRV